jgi:hypothetical protein
MRELVMGMNMNIEEFFAANESTIETNPVVWLNKGAKRIVVRILPPDLPPDLRIALLRSRLSALHARGKDAIERGRADLIDGILADFANDVRAALNFERTSGALKIVLAADEVRRCAGWFEENAWRQEPWLLAQILEQGETIDKPNSDSRHIKTSKRTFTRRDPAFDALRPVNQSREHWYSQVCTPESVIAEAEAATKREAKEAARPFSDFSGPNVAPR